MATLDLNLIYTEIRNSTKLGAVDGIAILDEDLNLIESNLPIELLSQDISSTVKDMLMKADYHLGEIDSVMLLAAKGVWSLLRIKDRYLLVLAGNKKPVNVPLLAELLDKITLQASMNTEEISKYFS